MGLSTSRTTAAVLAWVGATLFGLAVATGTRLGPTVLDLSATRGVHLGDALAFAGAYAVAALVTAALVGEPHQNRK